MTEALADLSARVGGLTSESLAQNDVFLDVLAQASEDAAKTGQREKLEELRNAVLNAALPSDIDADQQAIFLRHISDFTPSHLRLLKLLSDPPAWFAEHGLTWPDGLSSGSLRTIVEWGMPELAGKREMADQLVRDLTSAGMTTSGLDGMMTAEGLKARRASATGAAFLRFITDPRQDGDATG